MTKSSRGMRSLLAVLLLAVSGWASAQMSFGSIVVFGSSLSDPGNAFSLLAHPVDGLSLDGSVIHNTPPYDALDESLVPGAPYARGGHHFSNGATWIEQFAQGRGLAGDVAPAFRSGNGKARNYAVGGARATNYDDRVNLPQQVDAFLGDVGGAAPGDALYVIEIGSNDIRDALVRFLTVYQTSGGDQAQATAAASAVITDALGQIGYEMQRLSYAGARKFLVWNAPRIALTPAVRAFGPLAQAVADSLTDGFNYGLANNVLTPLGGLGIEIAQLDISSHMTAIIADPDSYGLSNVTDACVTPGLAPFTCGQPDGYFFWDGIHPTKAIHAVIGNLTAATLAAYPGP
ncbi:GDSL family lipase [Parasulfuritortus cantonensis]|uniref:GDSL family lipase n=1 Tax=Parasulfuritortus cantonensis TaxID=2528202 RepID=A0A4R1B1A2_9PROT|nr:SGNH/GDSL hydrolase family protein [Parasulfuritortus cantonensis]TCJ11792.1 GDSL family lipase [Parasulfuritortus cantonensis]